MKSWLDAKPLFLQVDMLNWWIGQFVVSFFDVTNRLLIRCVSLQTLIRSQKKRSMTFQRELRFLHFYQSFFPSMLCTFFSKLHWIAIQKNVGRITCLTFKKLMKAKASGIAFCVQKEWSTFSCWLVNQGRRNKGGRRGQMTLVCDPNQVSVSGTKTKVQFCIGQFGFRT